MVFLVFPRKKLVFGGKTKVGFWTKKPTVGFLVQNHLFPKTTENQLFFFLEFGHIVSQKMFFLVFLVFPRKKLVFRSKTIFFLGKSGFLVQNHFFPGTKLVCCLKPFFV